MEDLHKMGSGTGSEEGEMHRSSHVLRVVNTSAASKKEYGVLYSDSTVEASTSARFQLNCFEETHTHLLETALELVQES